MTQAISSHLNNPPTHHPPLSPPIPLWNNPFLLFFFTPSENGQLHTNCLTISPPIPPPYVNIFPIFTLFPIHHPNKFCFSPTTNHPLHPPLTFIKCGPPRSSFPPSISARFHPIHYHHHQQQHKANASCTHRHQHAPNTLFSSFHILVLPAPTRIVFTHILAATPPHLPHHTSWLQFPMMQSLCMHMSFFFFFNLLYPFAFLRPTLVLSTSLLLILTYTPHPHSHTGKTLTFTMHIYAMTTALASRTTMIINIVDDKKIQIIF